MTDALHIPSIMRPHVIFVIFVYRIHSTIAQASRAHLWAHQVLGGRRHTTSFHATILNLNTSTVHRPSSMCALVVASFVFFSIFFEWISQSQAYLPIWRRSYLPISWRIQCCADRTHLTEDANHDVPDYILLLTIIVGRLSPEATKIETKCFFNLFVYAPPDRMRYS